MTSKDFFKMAELIKNQKAKFDFEVLETFEAGIELKGYEVKALKSKMGSFKGSRVMIRGGEAILIGMFIPPYQKGNVPKDYDEYRERKLLLNKKEILYLAQKSKGLTIIPLRMYTKRGLIKVEIALAKTRRKPDKRRKIQEREKKRDIERALKRKY